MLYTNLGDGDGRGVELNLTNRRAKRMRFWVNRVRTICDVFPMRV